MSLYKRCQCTDQPASMKAAGLSKSFKFLPDDTDISNIVHFYKFKTNEKQVIHLFAQVNIMARNKTLLIELSKTTAGVDHPGFDVTVDQQALNAVLRTSQVKILPIFCAWMLQQEWCKTAPVAENLGGPVVLPVPVSIPGPEAVIGQQVVTPGPASTDDHTKIMAQIEAERRKVLESQLRTAQAEANAAEAVAKAAEATAKVSETEAKIKEMEAVETERKLSEAKAVETERRLSEAKAVETERRETEEKQKALLQTPETPDDGVKVAAIADTSSSLKKRRREESPVDNNESKVQRTDTDEAPAPSAFWTFCMNVTEPFNAIAVLLQQSVDNINPAAGSAI